MENDKQEILKTEEVFQKIFSDKQRFSDNLNKYTGRFLKEKYDDNYFEVIKDFDEDEYLKAIDYQKENHDNFIKFMSKKKLDNSFDLEEGIVLTMCFDGDASLINDNKNIVFKKPKKEEVVALDLKHYGNSYGETFCINNSKTLYDHLTYIGAYLSNKLVGCCYIYEGENTYVMLDGLLVDENYRKTGVAKTIIKYIISNYGSHLFLHADNDDYPKDIYLKLGFKEVDRTYEYFKQL